MKERAHAFIENAYKKLKDANSELNKPEEDVVSFSVCKNAQHAIEYFLKGFLLKKETDPGNYKTIEELYDQCKLINSSFEKIDLTNIRCRSNAFDLKSCSEVSKVSNCFEVANKLDTFFREEKII